ncbi:hypothetical protein GCM10009678_44770 [Actinomadura kijaniata]|uniref:AcrR family transcriptional regulator n=1 Tax=Actinomadura namibiensis TaxID=182080 RepID=A0A7W3LWU9_ACTNM|nr:TetR/AcrR family transcriptional regulator [Actinomadura namibiensis]MBA8955774.1 AcrR family transcriptional regulator [Actinomadura namibiensis]
MRADARRNRRRITDAALALLGERGPDVPMEDIARAAGVGVGTLYRHFPDRRALLEEVAAGTLRDILAFGRRQDAPDRDGWDALLRVVRHCAGLPLALVKTLAAEAAPPERLALQQEVTALLAGLAGRAQKEGALRADLTPDQVVEVVSALVCRPGARADDALAVVVLDGLRR